MPFFTTITYRYRTAMRISPATTLFFIIRPKNAHRYARLLLTFPCACLLLLSAAFPCLSAPQDAASHPAISSPSSAPAPALSDFAAVSPGPDIQEMLALQKLWMAALARHAPEKAFGNEIQAMPSPVLTQWKNLSKRMLSWTAVEKLQNINGFFNRWESKNDSDNYGVEEYWAIPEEFLDKGGGDCEDFTIIKYLALRYFGWPEQELWILLGKDNKTGRHHAVLAARTGEKTFILDNLSRPAYLLIPEKQYMQNFTPHYAMNELDAWTLTEK
jgi:predicted transglutaminase-like cysteine proteinase